ncbi:ATP-dependent nuclease [Kutzneria sp. CA-103260]|uniref:ATP-dependent nuclease n=1 Tax=Kutzneria sp. CA-103260 TaxID=2802641 RepID=UPI001BA9251D|nr:AAA family ATPase [Kutzneria sp. CA-103260]QUQ67103.1 AAA domain, putative AbiEii toxin, Type IV TA system [Kutzneria sp. CA-103260]
MHVRLNKIKLLSGDEIEVASGVTAIVGPNNAGKTSLLGELQAKLSLVPGAHIQGVRVVASPALHKEGTFDEFLNWFNINYPPRPPGKYVDGPSGEPTYRRNGGNYVTHQFAAAWNNAESLEVLSNFLVLHLDAESRLNRVDSRPSYDLLHALPEDPMQKLFANRELERVVSDYMRRAFGAPLTVNRYAGSMIHPHVGAVSVPEDGPSPSRQYLTELNALPSLQSQGHGIRAFVGILLSILDSPFPIVLIDEPEAFLHPPQARLLGRILAERRDNGTQVIVATHSKDIIEGVTSVKAAEDDISIVRLTRNGDINHVAQLTSSAVADLYGDPLVRYYGVLDGLFSQGVVVCESEADCTYYRATLDGLDALNDGTPVSSLSLHFTHCGGKARIAKVVSVLRAAKVPVACIVDIDILHNEADFKGLIEEYGGDYAALRPRRNAIVDAMESRSLKVERVTARAKVVSIFDGKATKELGSGEANSIKEAVSPKSGWRDFKQSGASMLGGEALASFEHIDSELRKLGVFMVRCGELERFHPLVPAGNKAAWLRKVLEGELYLTSGEAREFVRDVSVRILEDQ